MRLSVLIFALVFLPLGFPAAAQTGGTAIQDEVWGKAPDGQPVHRFTMTNASGAHVAVIAQGAAIAEIWVPDRQGKLADVVLGYGTAADYANNSAQIGLTIGRYAGRIIGGHFKLDGQDYALATADGANSVHGGPKGFGTRLWTGRQVQTKDGPGVRFTLVSPDGDQGFPGEMTVSVTYVWTADNRLIMDYGATTTKPTVINLTQHTYYNMAGAGSGDVLQQVLKLDADFYTEALPNGTVTGQILKVADTPFDFSRGKPIGQDLMAPHPLIAANRGYLLNYVLRRSPIPGQTARAATLTDPVSGRSLQLFTTEPGLVLYTANLMNTERVMKGGVTYPLRSGVALEAQHFPDSPNHPEFPSTTLMPGEHFQSRTVMAFGVSG